MKLVRQPQGSDLCGQACVATICGITLDEACMLARTHGKTDTKHLKRVLHASSVPHDERRTRGFPPKGQTALLFWKSENGCHWMVWHKNKYYDPAAGVFRKTPKHAKNARVTSYLRVYPCPTD